MKITTFVCLIFLLLTSMATAEINKRHDTDSEMSGKRLDDLKDQVYEIKYDLTSKISSQYYIIKEQEKEIVELKLKIKDLESNLFQTTQSLRNLELEVWEIKKSSNQKMKADD